MGSCANTAVCQKKRSAETKIAQPVCDICIVGGSGVPVCGCATNGGAPKKRASDKICPLFCITTTSGEELCGCAAEAYEESLEGN